jgi:hypothetical protein
LKGIQINVTLFTKVFFTHITQHNLEVIIIIIIIIIVVVVVVVAAVVVVE